MLCWDLALFDKTENWKNSIFKPDIFFSRSHQFSILTVHACFLSISGAADFISIEVQAWFPPIKVGACFACFLRLHLISAAHLVHKWLNINQLFDSEMTPSAQIYNSGYHFSTLTFIIYKHKPHSKLSYFDNLWNQT